MRDGGLPATDQVLEPGGLELEGGDLTTVGINRLPTGDRLGRGGRVRSRLLFKGSDSLMVGERDDL